MPPSGRGSGSRRQKEERTSRHMRDHDAVANRVTQETPCDAAAAYQSAKDRERAARANDPEGLVRCDPLSLIDELNGVLNDVWSKRVFASISIEVEEHSFVCSAGSSALQFAKKPRVANGDVQGQNADIVVHLTHEQLAETANQLRGRTLESAHLYLLSLPLQGVRINGYWTAMKEFGVPYGAPIKAMLPAAAAAACVATAVVAVHGHAAFPLPQIHTSGAVVYPPRLLAVHPQHPPTTVPFYFSASPPLFDAVSDGRLTSHLTSGISALVGDARELAVQVGYDVQKGVQEVFLDAPTRNA